MELRRDQDVLNSLDLTFDDFTDKVVIGKGKDCKIFCCRCPRLLQNERVAIKAYEKAKLSSVKQRSVRREARMMRLLTVKQIPNTTRFYGAFTDETHVYIVMEYCRKGDLLELLIREGRAMTERRIVNMVALPLLSTLQNMHKMGLIHRDIKLENIFVDEDMNVKLGDFGLTMSTHEERAISPVGTVEYMAPELVKLPPVDEVLSGRVRIEEIPPVDEKVDVWALGVTCFELVSGRSPFEGPNKDEVKLSIRENRSKALPSFVTRECSDFIQWMMTYDAQLRPSTGQLLVHQFVTRYSKSLAVTPKPVSSAPSRCSRTAGKSDLYGSESGMSTATSGIGSPKIPAAYDPRVPVKDHVTPRSKSERGPRKPKSMQKASKQDLKDRHVSEASPAPPLLPEPSPMASRRKTRAWSRFTRFWSISSPRQCSSSAGSSTTTFGTRVTDFLNKKLFKMNARSHSRETDISVTPLRKQVHQPLGG